MKFTFYFAIYLQHSFKMQVVTDNTYFKFRIMYVLFLEFLFILYVYFLLYSALIWISGV